jgi:Mg2+/Co2+ transporter CorB
VIPWQDNASLLPGTFLKKARRIPVSSAGLLSLSTRIASPILLLLNPLLSLLQHRLAIVFRVDSNTSSRGELNQVQEMQR